VQKVAKCQMRFERILEKFWVDLYRTCTELAPSLYRTW